MKIDIHVENLTVHVGGDAIHEVMQKNNTGIVSSGDITLEKIQEMINNSINKE